MRTVSKGLALERRHNSFGTSTGSVDETITHRKRRKVFTAAVSLEVNGATCWQRFLPVCSLEQELTERYVSQEVASLNYHTSIHCGTTPKFIRYVPRGNVYRMLTCTALWFVCGPTFTKTKGVCFDEEFKTHLPRSPAPEDISRREQCHKPSTGKHAQLHALVGKVLPQRRAMAVQQPR